jgi:N-acetylglutamate synthase-like GNAT family acetyltransferase
VKDLAIRPAKAEDHESVITLSRKIDPEDYLPVAWPLWMKRDNAVNLVAQVDDQIIGCVHGEIIAPSEAWEQGIRVHPEMRRLGVATGLLARLQEALWSLGARRIFGTVSRSNEPSLALFSRLGRPIVSRISRRKARGRVGSLSSSSIPPVSDEEVLELLHQNPVLASRRELSHFKRAYFSLTGDFLVRMLELGRVRISYDRRSFALLDLDARESAETLWVVALAGETASLEGLLKNVLIEAGALHKGVLVESPERPDLQAMLDELGFDPPEKDGRYVVIQKTL